MPRMPDSGVEARATPYGIHLAVGETIFEVDAVGLPVTVTYGHCDTQ